eukprot:GDKI01046614.1.p2 GENE.GDKI01046614.1~~GDKI01046614.1.p2  ORF type:complete len:131 (-),score=25.39 GDKI01046614.1:413-805(-)
MSRPFDSEKNAYREDHQTSSDQECRHGLADNLLQHYGAKPENYEDWAGGSSMAGGNYTQGSKLENSHDKRLDNAIVGEGFCDAGNKSGYDVEQLKQPSSQGLPGMNEQQQLDGLQKRMDTARSAYMQRDG